MKNLTSCKLLLLFLLALGANMLTGCANQYGNRHTASVVDFLYPDSKDPQVQPGIPVLNLALASRHRLRTQCL